MTEPTPQPTSDSTGEDRADDPTGTVAQRVVAALELAESQLPDGVEFTPERRAEVVDLVLSDTSHLRWRVEVDVEKKAEVVIGAALRDGLPEHLSDEMRDSLAMHIAGKSMRAVGDQLVEAALLHGRDEDGDW